jgi:hypothetical protein
MNIQQLALVEFDFCIKCKKVMRFNTNVYDGNIFFIEVYTYLQLPLTLVTIKFLGV